MEAPERLNVYRGNVVLDGTGAATVRLPRYFGALNVDYSYQLTPIGPSTSVLYIARKISRAGTFRIAGCLLYTSPSPRDGLLSRMPSSA